MNEIPDLALLLIAGLAAARITSLIVHDDIFEPIRHQVFLLFPPHEEPGEEVYTVVDRHGRVPAQGAIWRQPTFIGRLLSCTHCVGVWVAGAAYGALLVLPSAPVAAVLVVAALAQISELAIKASR